MELRRGRPRGAARALSPAPPRTSSDLRPPRGPRTRAAAPPSGLAPTATPAPARTESGTRPSFVAGSSTSGNGESACLTTTGGRGTDRRNCGSRTLSAVCCSPMAPGQDPDGRRRPLPLPRLHRRHALGHRSPRLWLLRRGDQLLRGAEEVLVGALCQHRGFFLGEGTGGAVHSPYRSRDRTGRRLYFGAEVADQLATANGSPAWR